MSLTSLSTGLCLPTCVRTGGIVPNSSPLIAAMTFPHLPPGSRLCSEASDDYWRGVLLLHCRLGHTHTACTTPALQDCESCKCITSPRDPRRKKGAPALGQLSCRPLYGHWEGRLGLIRHVRWLATRLVFLLQQTADQSSERPDPEASDLAPGRNERRQERP